MILKRLELSNFLCYLGDNEIEFGLPGKKHLTFIRGSNRGGKTSILRAINWVLYGKDTLNKCKESLDWLNYSAAEKKVFSFSVTLTAEKDKTIYELIRKVSIKKGINEPKTDEDFIEDFFVLEDGSAKSGDEQKKIVNYLLDEEVSDLFLFDGEKLQDYKDLLEGKGKSNLLKKKIEKVMRKPHLVSTKQDIEKFYAEYQKKVIVENTEETYKSLLEDISTLTELKIEKEQNIQELSNLITDQDTNISEINKSLQADQDKTDASTRLNELSGIIKTVEVDLNAKKNALKDQSSNIYKALINKCGIETSSDSNLRELYVDSLKGSCPICGEDLKDSQKKEIQKKLKNMGEKTTELEFSEIPEEDIPSINEIKILTGEVDQLSFDLQDAITERQSLLEEVTPEDGKSIHEKVTSLLNANREKERLEGLILENENELKGPNAIGIKDLYYDSGIYEALTFKENLQEEFAENNKFAKKVSKITNLLNCIDEIIEGYMEDMKQEIESSANEFNDLMTVGDAKQTLVINDNFGLQLRNASERNTSTSSSGDQIIALSLLFSLRKATKMEGPFLIDTPFGRVDFDQEETITDSLVDQSNQLILLCQPKEIAEKGNVFKKISPKIGKHYRINSKNQYLSSIESS